MRIIFGILLTVCFSYAPAQEKLSWDDLSGVEYEVCYSEKWGMDVSFPIFDDCLKEFDGREVVIQGYFIPLDIEEDSYVLVPRPFTSMHSFNYQQHEVMSLKLDSIPNGVMYSKVKVGGTLFLNEGNLEEAIYILKDVLFLSR